MSLVEAAACALPIVATDVPGCREVVRNHVNGLLVAPRDSVQIADALQLLIEHPDLRTRFGGRSREIAANFSRDRILDRMFQIYGDLSTAS
jgi:glycosyltransferase involved in cell wall biosynthesis